MPQFDIFVDHHDRQIVKNVIRQPLSNIENMGKTVSSGPYKPNEPMKKGVEPKKSFLSNTGKALHQNTPDRKVFTPRAVNVESMIYSDDNEGFKPEEFEFSKPPCHSSYYKELIDMMLPEPVLEHENCPPSPPYISKAKYSLEDVSSCDEDFFKDFSDGDIDFQRLNYSDDDLGLPDLW